MCSAGPYFSVCDAVSTGRVCCLPGGKYFVGLAGTKACINKAQDKKRCQLPCIKI